MKLQRTALLGLLLILPLPPTGRLWDAFQSYLRLSGTELSSVDKGQTISKVLPSENPREVAVVGMIQVNVSSDVLITRFRDISQFKKSDQVLAIGKFSSPPRLQDLQALTLDIDDVEAIKACEAGRCGLKLSGGMIGRLRRGANNNPEPLFRQILLDYLEAYLANGNTELVKYEDKATTTNLAQEFQELMAASPYVRVHSPEFFEYLQNFPRGKPPGAEDFIYWSKEKLGPKPVISMTHVSIYKRPGTDEVLIVSKQIYGSHYFDSSMGITAAIARQGVRPGESGSYLLYLNRSRVDALGGTFSGVLATLLRSQILDGLTSNLYLAKERLEGR